ncbi:hypothetical protein Rsub_06831 [Raphidocelis subcapitata]|uniref:Uncharacterized protein n=1 Tax=Raphidocelis subcapitata TaxID=307507 RepID=A0A2V0P4J4_9CHLO|nr:hypothetical protein Rsub_06831 [Raphidocelis subcapitata]|eukprot:GBF93832.1 hypothetical protein Rsub_06831 [Raphidocelis subcapitata]
MKFAAKAFSPRSGGSGRRDWPCEERRASLAKVVCTLKAAVEKLQAAQGAAAVNERRKSAEQLTLQVQLLNSAFVSLADAVLEEIEELGGERAQLHADSSQLRSAMRALEARMQDRLSEAARLEDRVDAKLALTAGLEAQVAALAASGASTEARLGELRAEVAAMSAAASKAEKHAALAALEAQRAGLTALQRGQASGRLAGFSCWQLPLRQLPAQAALGFVKQLKVKELAAESLRDAVPPLVAAGVQRHAPPLIDDAVEARAAELRRDAAAQGALLAGDLGRLARDAAALRAEVAAASNLAKKVDADVAALEPRVARAEAEEAAAPKAPLRLVAALEERLEGLAGQQSRQSRGVESVIRALVDDASALARAQRGAEGLLAGQQAQLQDTKEALLRSAQARLRARARLARARRVFAQLLKVPAPVSAAQWTAVPTKFGAAGSPLRSAGLGLGLGGGSGGGGSPSAAGGSPLLSSRYAAAAAGL